MLSSYGARAMPRSVMMAVMRDAGVTSKAGWRAPTPSGANRIVWNCPSSPEPLAWVTSSEDRSSMGMSLPLAQAESIVVMGAAT